MPQETRFRWPGPSQLLHRWSSRFLPCRARSSPSIARPRTILCTQSASPTANSPRHSGDFQALNQVLSSWPRSTFQHPVTDLDVGRHAVAQNSVHFNAGHKRLGFGGWFAARLRLSTAALPNQSTLSIALPRKVSFLLSEWNAFIGCPSRMFS